MAQRYREAYYHLVELQDWPIAQQLLWMPLGNYPIHRQLWFWGHYSEALEFLSPLLPRSSEQWQCFLLYEVGQVQAILGNHGAALQAFEQQLSLAQTLKLPRAVIKGYGGLGRLYSYHQADTETALHYYQQQLRWARRYRDVLEEALALDGLGRVCFLQGQWRRSTYLYQQAWERIQGVTDPEAHRIQLLRLEGSYLRWSPVKDKRTILQHQLQVAQSAQNQQQIWEAAHYLGIAEADTSHWQAAHAAFEAAIAAAKAAQDIRNFSVSTAAQGGLYARRKEWRKAIACTEAVIPTIQQASDPVAEAVFWFNLSYCYSELNQPFRALRHATHIRRLAKLTKSAYVRGMLYLAVANANWHSRRWLAGLWLAGLGVFHLGWWRSADGRLALAKVFSVLRMEIGQ
ncbi:MULTISPECIES: tetratricopeptide repeat protein [Cyanophyceae]|uniref:tetratricopeptide repeat protein n=1 Tax=Cyanophyceae TaxID=3028117 RepID=UPI0016821A61|nr:MULTISPECIES: tetratricopeptide repeat protein [Cyanophyceae]MBD1915362.1 tetratricopeptide repeat protein [Phormidium sp. FACHB-77]MBD2049374.1 tetratricopeptide repeat protein [Leptolyngbya sp. FACHB-60]